MRTDAELLDDVRTGDMSAAGELFESHHGAALRYAGTLVDNSEAEELVSEAFARVLTSLSRGNGPREAFRPYLYVTIRNAWVDGVRRTAPETLVEVLPEDAVADTSSDPASRLAEGDPHIAPAFRSLPERWQSVLWLFEVDRESQRQIGKRLGLAPNAVAALLSRAREGLRQAYLHQHLTPSSTRECAEVTPLLPRYARHRLSAPQTAMVRQHIDGCELCTLALADLRRLDRRLGAYLFGAVVGTGSISSHGAILGFGAAALRWGRSQWHAVAAGTAAVAATGAIALVAHSALTTNNPVKPTPDAAPPAITGVPINLPPRPDKSVVKPVKPHPVHTATSAPVATPTPTPSPHATAPTPKPKPKPTPKPTPPKPTPTPTPTPVVIALGAPTTRPSEAGWTHAELTISTSDSADGLRVVLTSSGVVRVHTEPGYLPWSCSTAATVTTCQLPSASATDTLAFDVQGPTDHTVHIVVSSLTGTGDPASADIGVPGAPSAP